MKNFTDVSSTPKVKKVTQSGPTLCDPMDCSPPEFSRILEWVAISFSRGSSWSRNWIWVSHTAGRFFTSWATREAPIPKSWLRTIHAVSFQAHIPITLLKVTLLIFGYAGSLLLHGLFSSCGEQGPPSSCSTRASQLQWLLLLQSVDSGALGLQ